MSKSTILRNLIQSPGLLVVPGVYDCISARLAQNVGFECVFTSGFGISGSRLGMPDFGLLTATEMLDSVGKITASVEIPVVADIDTGYGSPLNVTRTVGELVRLGAAGFILEDQEWPKKCGHFEGKKVISKEEHVGKIKAAREEAGDLVIIGRTDARRPLGLGEAIERGRAYVEAGADILFIEAPESLEELKIIAKEFPDIPLFANMVEGGKTPICGAEELEGLGFKIAVYPVTALFSASDAILKSLEYLKQNRTSVGFGSMFSFKDFEELVGAQELKKFEEKFTPPN